MGWGNRVCHHCYKPYAVCSGECWGDREDCAGCSDAFDPDRLSECKLCEVWPCKQLCNNRLPHTPVT
jgi:hypothetical protein